MARHGNFISLAKVINAYGDGVERRALAMKIEWACLLAYNLMELTPVDRGTARSNWIAQVGSSPSRTRRAFVPGVALGRLERANLQAAYASTVATYSKAKPGQPLYLKNNLPYIKRLNEGHSKQSPAGFVQIATLNAYAIAKRRKLVD